MPPESSASVASRSMLAEVTADSSPMTWTMLTMETTPIMAQAAGSSTISNGMNAGRENQEALPTPETSTMPMPQASAKPPTMPSRMPPSLRVPLA